MTGGVLVGLAGIAAVALVCEASLGFGGTLIATCLGAQLVPLRVVVPAFVPLDLAISAWLALVGASVVEWRWLGREVAPLAALGIVPGIALAGVAAAWLPIAFGAVVTVLAARELSWRAVTRVTPAASSAWLALGGLAHGMFATGGPFVVYVARRRVSEPRAFRATLAVVWVALDAALIAWFVATGRYDREAVQLLGVFALVLVPALALGERLHRALPVAQFTRAAWVLLLAAGSALAVRGVLDA